MVLKEKDVILLAIYHRFSITSRFHCLAMGHEVNSISDIQILNIGKNEIFYDLYKLSNVDD